MTARDESSYEYSRGQDHGREPDGQLTAARPPVAAALALGVCIARAATPSVAAAGAINAGEIAGTAQRQAGVLGLLDVFRLVACVSLASAFVVAAFTLRPRLGRAGGRRTP